MNGMGLQGLTKAGLAKWIRPASILLAIPLLCACLAAQQKKSNASGEGQRIFSGNCAACHGLDGHGGERGPDIAGRREIQRRTDQALFRTVHDGIPTAGMPSFGGLGTPKIQAVIKYLRQLQNNKKAEPMPGDPKNGQTLFAGKAGCATCHMVKGEGGFIASDLSGYASGRPVSDIRDAIVTPGKIFNPRKSAMVATNAAGTYRGMVRNEDNFSLQLQTLDGVFHSFDKADLKSFEYESHPLMPEDYGVKFTQREIDDLVSFLMSASGSEKNKLSTEGEE